MAATTRSALVGSIYDALVAKLAVDDVIYVGDPDAVEPAVVLPLRDRVALEARPDFGGDDPSLAEIAIADRALRFLNRGKPSYLPLQVNYF